jgi:CHAT domain-containing protein
VPLNCQSSANGRHVIDVYQISYLGAGRDILRFAAAVGAEATAPMVMADPDFDLIGGGSAWASMGAALTEDTRGLDRAGLRFPRLPGTRCEGEQLADLLGIEPALAGAALETRVKECSSPRLLHIATHGFFLPDLPRDPGGVSFGMSTFDAQAVPATIQLSSARLKNPMLRSGLALAGANTWLRGESPPPEAEDGILTAEDVTGLDLLDTELVVLSACDTALGDRLIGEGVFGLRRAFAVAGAQTLVMSLWKVPDRQTAELMTNFYRRLLAGEGRAKALREAQLELKCRYPDPLYWGAFICQGNPSPMSKSGGPP